MAASKMELDISTSKEAIEAVNRTLQEKGMMVKRDAHSGRFIKKEAIPDFKPIPAKGKLVSEIIKEGRG